LAYEAFESPAQLGEMRQKAEKAKVPFRYRKDMAGRQLALQEGVKPVIRFAMPYKDISVKDLILGEVTVKGNEHDDIVIRKADGFPTYHFAVVVDDHYMGITHVLRAQEHLMNTFKHLGLYEALGWTPPEHAHLPLVFNMDNTKMSKREKAKAVRAALRDPPFVTMLHEFRKTDPLAKPYKGSTANAHYWPILRRTYLADAPNCYDVVADFLAGKNQSADLAIALATATGEAFPKLKISIPEIDVQDFRRSGYLPEALVNFIALVGWAPGGDREIMSREEMLELFSLEGIQKTSGRFDRKKLAWMNGEYIRKATLERLCDAVESFNVVAETVLRKADRATIKELLTMYQERMVTIAEMAENAWFFFEEPVYDAKAVEKWVKNNGGVEFLKAAQGILMPVTQWDKAGLTEPMERVLGLGEKRGAAAQALRVAVSGGAVSPPLLETLVLLGREKTLARVAGMLG
jgi:glutamyl/glutaminyl-tRNA synthetase